MDQGRPLPNRASQDSRKAPPLAAKATQPKVTKEKLEALFDQPKPPATITTPIIFTGPSKVVAATLEQTMDVTLNDIERQLEQLLKRKQELINRDRTSAIEDINKKIRAFDLKSKDLNFGARNEPSKNPVQPKFKLGDEVWSGRGRKPRWIEAHLAKGGRLDELLIK